MIEYITNLMNGILQALAGLSRIGEVLDHIPVSSVPEEKQPPDNSPDKPPDNKPPEPKGKPQGHAITIPEQVGANFYSKGSPAWANQPGGQHLGTDFLAPQGSAVYAPFVGTVIKLGRYTDSGRKGDYVMLTLNDGVEYYSGHLQNVAVREGRKVEEGDVLGYTNEYNHTHVQIRINGQLRDFEEYRRNKK